MLRDLLVLFGADMKHRLLTDVAASLKRSMGQLSRDGLGLVVVLYQPKTRELASFRVGLDKATAIRVLTRAEKEIT